MDLLKPNERIDYMYNDDLRIIQEKDAFSFSHLSVQFPHRKWPSKIKRPLAL